MGSWRCLVLGWWDIWDYSFCKCKQWLIFHCHVRNHIESRCIIECWSRSGDCSGNLTPTSGLTAQRCAEQIVALHWSIISETLWMSMGNGGILSISIPVFRSKLIWCNIQTCCMGAGSLGVHRKTIKSIQCFPMISRVWMRFLDVWVNRYPLVICYIAIENTLIIVSFPIKNGDFPWFFVGLPEGKPPLGSVNYPWNTDRAQEVHLRSARAPCRGSERPGTTVAPAGQGIQRGGGDLAGPTR